MIPAYKNLNTLKKEAALARAKEEERKEKEQAIKKEKERREKEQARAAAPEAGQDVVEEEEEGDGEEEQKQKQKAKPKKPRPPRVQERGYYSPTDNRWCTQAEWGPAICFKRKSNNYEAMPFLYSRTVDPKPHGAQSYECFMKVCDLCFWCHVTR